MDGWGGHHKERVRRTGTEEWRDCTVRWDDRTMEAGYGITNVESEHGRLTEVSGETRMGRHGIAETQGTVWRPDACKANCSAIIKMSTEPRFNRGGAQTETMV